MKIDYTRYYKKWHPDTPEHRAAMTSYYRRIFENRVPPRREAAILDVGCGAGFSMLALKQMGYSAVEGIDSDEGQVSLCRKNELSVSKIDDTVAFLKSHAKSYDVVLAFDLIEHIPHDDQLDFASALCGALRQGGILICTVPNANSSLASRWRYIDWTHHCSFTEHSLELLLTSVGFDDVQVSAVEFLQKPSLWWLPVSGGRHWWAFRFFRFWRRLEMMAELGPQEGRRVPLSLNLLGVARKKPPA